MYEGEGRQVRLVEPVDGDAAFFDTIPPKLCLSTRSDFPIVGHDGAAKKVSRTYNPFLWKEVQFGTELAEWVIYCKTLGDLLKKVADSLKLRGLLFD